MTEINPTAIAVLATAGSAQRTVAQFESGHGTYADIHQALRAFHDAVFAAGGAVITADSLTAIVREHLDRCRDTIPAEVRP